MVGRTLSIALVLLTWAGTARAESVAEIFEHFGIIGAWAENCKAPPRDDNWYVEYSALPSGHVARKHFKGAEPSFEYDVYEAKVSGNRISFSIENVDPRHRQFGVTLIKRGDTIRVWDSTNEYGHSQVIDGRAVDTRIVTNWLMKCR